ncbi:MAG: hypothetical protein ABL977_16690 [Candidatus Eisenbacteria bacterium]
MVSDTTRQAALFAELRSAADGLTWHPQREARSQFGVAPERRPAAERDAAARGCADDALQSGKQRHALAGLPAQGTRAAATLDRVLHDAITVNIFGHRCRLEDKLESGIVQVATEDVSGSPGVGKFR